MIGTGELVVIFFIILILFGGKKLPELARSIGLGIREFKKACNEIEEDIEKPCTSKKQSAQEPVTLIVEPDHQDDSKHAQR